MQLQIGKPCGRFILMVLAFAACAIQVLDCTLPSQVVCREGDRPPRFEFFSDSCSCRQEKIHACTDPNEYGVFCIKESCTDIHLKSHALVAASRAGTCLAGRQRRLAAKQSITGFALIYPRWVSETCAIPKAASPPPLAFPSSDSNLRC